jgi:uncharacterized membrane protein
MRIGQRLGLIIATAAWATLPSMALAEEAAEPVAAETTAPLPLPALFGVAGVEESDKLNVRAGPSTENEIVTKLAPSATSIEVVATDDSGEWGLIALPEGRGWAALRYLVRAPGQPETGLPNQLTCAGTEPFWSFNLAQDRTAEFVTPDASTLFQNVAVVPSSNRTDRHALFADGGEVAVTSLVGRGICSDGMSDRPYGLSIDLLVTDETAVTLYSGCCSVAPRPTTGE